MGLPFLRDSSQALGAQIGAYGVVPQILLQGAGLQNGLTLVSYSSLVCPRPLCQVGVGRG